MISLLYNNPSAHRSTEKQSRLIYHLSIDRSFAKICSDINKTDYFFSVLSSPLKEKEEIEFRKEILCDLNETENLFTEFCSLYRRFNELHEFHKSAKKNNYRINFSNESSIKEAGNNIQTNAITLKKALLFIKGFCELLSKYEIRSCGLQKFKEECKKIYENENFDRLIKLCGKYEYMSTMTSLAFRLVLDENGRMDEYSFIDPNKLNLFGNEEKQKGFFRFKKTEEYKIKTEPLNPIERDFYNNAATDALSDIAKTLEYISNQIFEKFSEVYTELTFYEIALNYIKTLKNKSIPYCFADISENGAIKIKELRDLYLLMTKNSPSDVVSNDLEMSDKTKGIVVFGNNGSGKTVFLRSIATMQLLSQAGLPVTAKEAEISIFSDIFTQFSEAEKEFCEGNDAGRFEQEVREMADIVENIKDGSLVFLNETFQSTAYAEGAEGLYYLLKYFSERGIRWILVSHLTQIKDLFSDGEAVILKTAPGYKIIK